MCASLGTWSPEIWKRCHGGNGRGLSSGVSACVSRVDSNEKIDAVVMEAQKRVEQGKPQLDLDNIANLRWPSTWPDEGESRTMRAKVSTRQSRALTTVTQTYAESP